MKTAQMSWRLGPGMDWLAHVGGLREGTLVKNVSALELSYVKPNREAWMEPTMYCLKTETFYHGRRNGELVYFFIDSDGGLEPLTEQEFVCKVYDHYESHMILWSGDETNPGSFIEDEGGLEQMFRAERQLNWCGDPPLEAAENVRKSIRPLEPVVGPDESDNECLEAKSSITWATPITPPDESLDDDEEHGEV